MLTAALELMWGIFWEQSEVGRDAQAFCLFSVFRAAFPKVTTFFTAAPDGLEVSKKAPEQVENSSARVCVCVHTAEMMWRIKDLTSTLPALFVFLSL